MRLLERQRTWKYPKDVLRENRAYSVAEIEDLIQQQCKQNGDIDSLFIVFEDQNIPLIHESEGRIVACLLSTYHNNCINCNVQVNYVFKL